MEEKQCAICKKKLPEFNKDGEHNFAPHVIKGNIQDLCIECKMIFVRNSPAWTEDKIIR